MSILSAAEIAAITSDIRTIVRDDVISTDIIYRKLVSGVSSYDPTSGEIPVGSYEETGVSVFKGSYTLKEIQDSGGLIEMGHQKFILMTSDVSGVLSVDDKIYELGSTIQSATTYEILDISFDPLRICYFVQSKAV